VSVDSIIEDVIGREGGYSDHPADRGGKTMWGITESVARANGYHGEMRQMPREVAKGIYLRRYVTGPGFGGVMSVSEKIAEELVDTGVNMGPAVASLYLQRALNALNNNGKIYNDIIEDGDVGTATLNALRAYLRARKGPEGEAVMLKALNCLQGARYIELATKRTANQAFLFGWLRTRVSL
jgi:lysozyme family protein